MNYKHDGEVINMPITKHLNGRLDKEKKKNRQLKNNNSSHINDLDMHDHITCSYPVMCFFVFF